MKSRDGSPQSDHLILLNDRAGSAESRGGNFFERNWSAAWINFLVQEVGPYTLSSIRHFEWKDLDLYRFVYLPSSLPAKWVEENQTRLESYIQSGRTLIIEGPVANALQCAGIKFLPKRKPFESITSIPPGIVPYPLAESLLRMPLKTMGWKISSQASEISVLLEMEGQPVFFKRTVGRGRIFILGFDFGLLLVGLQQGIPVKGACRLQKLFGTQSRVIEPEDLVLKASLLDNPIPWADLFERFFSGRSRRTNPRPAGGTFPILIPGRSSAPTMRRRSASIPGSKPCAGRKNRKESQAAFLSSRTPNFATGGRMAARFVASTKTERKLVFIGTGSEKSLCLSSSASSRKNWAGL